MGPRTLAGARSGIEPHSVHLLAPMTAGAHSSELSAAAGAAQGANYRDAGRA